MNSMVKRSRLSGVGKFRKGQHVLVRVLPENFVASYHVTKMGEKVWAKPCYRYVDAIFVKAGKSESGKPVAFVKSPELAMERVDVPFPLYKKLKVAVPISQVVT